MNNIGMMYENGAMQGGADIEKAVQWYTLSARHGQPVAQQNLIRLGRTVPAVDLVTAQQQDNTGAAILAAGLLGAAVANTNRPSTTNTTIVTPPPTQKTPINCTSTEVFGSVQTTCR